MTPSQWTSLGEGGTKAKLKLVGHTVNMDFVLEL